MKIGELAELANASAKTTAPTRARVSYHPRREVRPGIATMSGGAELIGGANRTASPELLGHIRHGSGRGSITAKSRACTRLELGIASRAVLYLLSAYIDSTPKVVVWAGDDRTCVP